jgi:hypothetical protein
MLALVLTNSLTLGDLLVGVGTLALAGFTAWLGFSTRASAKAAQEAVESSEEPFVIATPTDNLEAMILRPHELPQGGTVPPFTIHRALDVGGKGSFVRLRLWNIGQGPAIVTAVHLRSSAGGELAGQLPQHYAIGAGGIADIEIPSPGWPAQAGPGLLTIDYFRASGVRYRTTSEVDIGDPLVICKTYRRSCLSHSA